MFFEYAIVVSVSLIIIVPLFVEEGTQKSVAEYTLLVKQHTIILFC